MTEALDSVASTPGPIRTVIRKHGTGWHVHHRGRTYRKHSWQAALDFACGMLHLDAIAERFTQSRR